MGWEFPALILKGAQNMKDIKVIEIPDKTRIIINIGYSSDPHDFNELNSYIKVGDSILVTEKGISIKDINGHYLGQYSPIKAELTVTEVYENFSVARKKVISEKNPIKNLGLDLLTPVKTTNFEDIKVNEQQIKNVALSNEEINIGDLVKVIDNKNY